MFWRYVSGRVCQDFITFQNIAERKKFHYGAQPGPPPTPNHKREASLKI